MTDIQTQGPARDFIGYGRRPPFVTWPGGAKVAINLVLIYEEGSEYSWVEDGRNDNWGEYNLSTSPNLRDLGTETHFEYGSRAGVWRLARLFDRYRVPVTVSACAVALQRNPDVAAWMKDRGHDLLGHGLRWTDYPGMDREEERRQLQEAIALYREVLGVHPAGWNCRSFPSVNTRDLIIESGGFLYYSDPCNDDIPYFVKHDDGDLLVVPYSKTLNDSRYLIAPGYSNPRDFSEDCRSAIDYLIEEADETGGKMLTIAAHARWSGQPNRASGLRDVIGHVGLSNGRAVFMRREDIARHWLANHELFRKGA
ncbi:peptidoglycan/xylan/chitin deacetylase (PgdA/CDA1 family) [Paraburkholderia youngii]|uniref:polysaccharide deacetylase family protein n=1 Tax=Paraburkholderia youngii TaxID=2782701 RepID=UPI003D2173E8